MQQLEAVGHAEDLQLLQAAQHLADGEAEFRSVAARDLPAPAAARRQLDPHADRRPDADLLGVLEDQGQLGVFFDHRDDAAADLLRQHRHLDELGVLEAVADDRRVVVGQGGDDQQLRLRSGLQPETVLPAEFQHFFDDLPLLVDLDRVDADVAAGVVVLGDGGLKGFLDVPQPMLEHVAKADQRRQGDAAHLQLIDELFEINRPAGLLRRMDVNVAVLADRKVSLAPSVNLVQLGCIRGRPRFSDFVRGTPLLDRNRHGLKHTENAGYNWWPPARDGVNTPLQADRILAHGKVPWESSTSLVRP